jgi:hypothetical protein
METAAYVLIVVGNVVEKRSDEYTSKFLGFLENMQKNVIPNNAEIEILAENSLLIPLRDKLQVFSRVVSMATKNNLTCHTIFFTEKPVICSSKNS